MMKRLMLGAAVSALMLSGAMAQAPTPSGPGTPPAATQDKPMAKPDAAKPDQAAPAAKADQAGGKQDFVMSQKPDQWLASKFRGTDVLGADNKKIGDISDILFDKTGKIEAFVVSVGGFLGMGAKDVAMAPGSFEVVPGQNGAADQLKVTLSQDQLKQAQNFEPYQPPRPVTTTGAGGPGGSSRPLGGGPAGR